LASEPKILITSPTTHQYFHMLKKFSRNRPESSGLYAKWNPQKQW
jgi:hypothetical protein